MFTTSHQGEMEQGKTWTSGLGSQEAWFSDPPPPTHNPLLSSLVPQSLSVLSGLPRGRTGFWDSMDAEGAFVGTELMDVI